MSLIQCAVCGCDVIAIQKTHKYCGPCRIKAARDRERVRKQRNRDAYAYTYRKYEPVEDAVKAPVRTRKVKAVNVRYATLAETPEVPAEHADRADQLTGGAPAAGYAQAVRMGGVGI